jgi:hypothetical protein
MELYRRMLLWMSHFWTLSADPDLMDTAWLFALQLSDEQYVVPGHPFMRALTARSLDAAMAGIGTEGDPRGRTRKG